MLIKVVKILSVVMAVLALTTPGLGQNVVTEFSGVPTRNTDVIFYDNSFLFLARHHGDQRYFGGNTEPGFFVHSKVHDRWLKIVKISTKDGVFGKSWSDDKEEQRKLKGIPAAWNFTSLASQEFADLPLRTSGSIAFPDKIESQENGQKYQLGFMTRTGVKTAATYLYISRADLERKFEKRKEP